MLKRYDNTFRFAEVVLKNLGWKSEEINAALTDDVVQHLANCTREQQKALFGELNEARLRSIEEADDVPLVMKSADFRCTNAECAHVIRDEIVDVPANLPLSRVTFECPKCGADASWFIPHGTRMAVQGEENVPSERLRAAREGLVRNPPPGFEPYRGDGSRSDLAKWEEKHSLAPMASDEGRRGNSTINSKTKFTQTVAFEQELAQHVDRSVQIAEAGGDRLAEAKRQIGKPNDYDVNSFKEQAGGGIVDGSAPLTEGNVPIADVAEELAVVQRGNQSRDHIAPDRQ